MTARSSDTYRANRLPVSSETRAMRRQSRYATHPYTPRGKLYKANGKHECERRLQGMPAITTKVDESEQF